MLETGDFGGDKLSGLTRYVEEPRQADVLLGSTSPNCCVRRWLTLAVPRRADVLETGDFGGDKLSGLEFAGFSRQNTDFGAWRTPGAGFRRKTSEFDAGVVDFVEALHGLVAVVLPALQQVVHGHGAAVVVDVVAALAVGEDLDALDEAGGVGRGWGQRVGAVRVPDAEGDLDRLGVDEGRAAGQRDAADPRGCGGERAAP